MKQWEKRILSVSVTRSRKRISSASMRRKKGKKLTKFEILCSVGGDTWHCIKSLYSFGPSSPAPATGGCDGGEEPLGHPRLVQEEAPAPAPPVR
jgi:hypothetical protein